MSKRSEEAGPAALVSSSQSDVGILKQDQQDIQQIYQQLRSAEAKLIGPDGETQSLPPNIHGFLYQLLAHLSAGYSVTILQANATLTTVEASKLLGVSRQFLINLLNQGAMPYHKVGTHRRLYARDVLAYKKNRDAERHKILDDLSQAEASEGLYERTFDDTDCRK